jgi:hypothetical protein
MTVAIELAETRYLYLSQDNHLWNKLNRFMLTNHVGKRSSSYYGELVRAIIRFYLRWASGSCLFCSLIEVLIR